jgi:hypothetical protein
MQRRFGLRLVKPLVINLRNCIVWILEMYFLPFSPFYLHYIFHVVVDVFAASMYAETREEARDYARLRNMCFDQVRI